MIYFDNSATTKPYPEVLDTYRTVSEQFFANPSSLHKLGGASENLLNKARQQAASLLGTKESEITFTSGGTEGNNLAIKGTAFAYKQRGKHLITSKVEHASSYLAFKQLEQFGFDVTYIQPDHDGSVSAELIKRAIREDTILVSLIHVNNELGSVQPIEEIALLLSNYPKIAFHVDHIQGVGKVPLPFRTRGIDLCTISGHKFHGPKGTGLLYVRDGIHLSPLFSGGDQEINRRAGTENLPGIVAMVKALRMTLANSSEGVPHLIHLKDMLITAFMDDGNVKVNTPLSYSAPHILNVSVKGIKTEVLIHALEEEAIYISTKSACTSKETGASRVLTSAGISEQDALQAIRISLSFQNTEAEVKTFLKALNKHISRLQKVMR